MTAPVLNPVSLEDARHPDRGASGADDRFGAHPPKPRFVLNVGVTGHRPPRLSEEQFPAAKEAAREILAGLQSRLGKLVEASGMRFEPELPSIRVISSLAEGADRAVAEAALDLGLEIQAPLPFHRDEYERDFATPESRAQYQRLLSIATAVFEMDGSREDEGSAYLNAGRVMLEQSDLLIALWDGKREKKRGGTAEIVGEALTLGVPVIHVRLAPEPGADRPLPITLLGDTSGLPWRERLHEKLLHDLPHGLVLDEENGSRAERYFSETERRFNHGWLFAFFRNLVCWRKPWGGAFFLPRYLEKTAAESDLRWREFSALPDAIELKLNASFRAHDAWADNLAKFYAGLFRTAYLLRYLFSTVVIVFTVIGSYSSFAWQGFLLQFVSVAALIGLVLLERKKQWHLRSLEYRLMAEQLRVLHFLFPLGWGLERVAGFDAGLRTPPRWITRHLRGVTREAGLVSAVVTPAYLTAYRAYLRSAEVEEQIRYHRTTAAWEDLMARRLYGGAMLFFALGILAFLCRALAYRWMPEYVAHATGDAQRWQERLVFWVRVFSILFPALGAALAGLRSHGEFTRLALRSAMMVAFFEAKRDALDFNADASWEGCIRLTREIADEMMSELVDWRTLVAGKGLSLPV